MSRTFYMNGKWHIEVDSEFSGEETLLMKKDAQIPTPLEYDTKSEAIEAMYRYEESRVAPQLKYQYKWLRLKAHYETIIKQFKSKEALAKNITEEDKCNYFHAKTTLDVMKSMEE